MEGWYGEDENALPTLMDASQLHFNQADAPRAWSECRLSSGNVEQFMNDLNNYYKTEGKVKSENNGKKSYIIISVATYQSYMSDKAQAQ